jgi:hypothetical protein
VKQVLDILVTERPVILLFTGSELPRYQGDIIRLRPVGRRVVLRQPSRLWPDRAHQVWSVG